jgi:hypothetical protein
LAFVLPSSSNRSAATSAEFAVLRKVTSPFRFSQYQKWVSTSLGPIMSSIFCLPAAAFYNVGRGDTVDQDALIGVLNSGHLAAAYLDVTTPEPLPCEDPLWSAPNCLITPHVAGGMQGEMDVLVDHFVANFKRYLANEPLKDIVKTLGK